MTVSYQYEVASSTSGGFTRLLFMWRGSLYKLIYRELLLFLIFFGAISALYRHILSVPQKRAFEEIVVYCDTFINLIPLSFVLGFYVAYVAGRWWQQYTAIPWPDKVMHLVALYVTGNDEYGRMLRRALMRYLNLSLILVLRSISSAVKRRFPTLDHVVDSGFMTSLELELFQSVPSVEFNTYWIPCTWFINLLKEARRSHRLPDAQGLKIIMEEFNDFRSKCGLLWSYDWVSIPLVYTQVVTLATYSFFAVALVGRQYIEGAIKPFQMQIDTYFPVFTVLQFFFFMGLLKVAEQLINPFGDDDEDFELNWLIDRHTKVSYLGVDTLMNRCPPLVKDIYYDSENVMLPYTEAAAAYKRKTYRGSVANMMVPEEKQTMFLPDITEEDEDIKNIPTPRASNANLAANLSDSSNDEKRQISGSPVHTPPKTRNSVETIIPMDIQQGSSVHSDRTRMTLITDAVKKLSGKSNSSFFPEQNRKPFLSLVKSAKIGIQPWPSATNLVHSAKSQSTEETSPMRRNSFNLPTIDVRRPSSDDETNRDEPMAFVNETFSEERLPADAQTSKSCDCDSQNSAHNVHSDVCQFQCRHENICQHEDDTVDISTTETFRPRLHSFPKHFLKKQRFTHRKKKGVRWKPSVHSEDKIRRRTIDSVPTAKMIVSQSMMEASTSDVTDLTDENNCSKCAQLDSDNVKASLDNDEDEVSDMRR